MSWITITAVEIDDAICILVLLLLSSLADQGEIALFLVSPQHLLGLLVHRDHRKGHTPPPPSQTPTTALCRGPATGTGMHITYITWR